MPRRLFRLPTLVAVPALAAAMAVVPTATAVATSSGSGTVVVGFYTAAVAPTSVVAGTTSSYAYRVANLSLLPVRSVRIAVPAGFTVTSLGSAVVGRDTWALSVKPCTGANNPAPCTAAGTSYLQADALGTKTSGPMWPLMSALVTFTASAPSTAGTYTWGTAVTTLPKFAGVQVARLGANPTTKVTPATPSALVLSGLPPGGVTAGTPFSVTLTAVDPSGGVVKSYRGTVHFSLLTDGGGAPAAMLLAAADPSGGSLPGDYTFTAADAGVHTFTGLVLTSAPSQGFSVADVASPGISGSVTVAVAPGAASQLVLSAPGSATAGASFVAAATVYDAYGNVATGYRGTVQVTSSDTGAHTQLPADHLFTAGDAGSWSFTATLTQAGGRSLTATDTAHGALTDTAAIDVGPAQSQSLVLTGPGGPVTAGSAFAVTASVVDAFGNPVPTFTGTVHLSTDADGATLPDDYTFLPGDGGTHTFTGVTLRTAADTTLTASDTGDGLVDSSTVVTVVPAAASALVVTSALAQVTAGQPLPVDVRLVDPYGNLATTSSATVHLDCGQVGPDGSCPAPTATSGGLLTLNPVLTLVGTQTVAASAAGLGSDSITVDVVAAGPAALAVSAPAAPVVAGATFGVTATVLDAYGNQTDAAIPVHLDALPSGTPFPVDATSVGGVASFTGLVAKVAGAYALSASADGLSTGAGALTVVPAAATQVVLSTPPPGAVQAGTPFTLTATLRDAFNNVETDDNSSIVTVVASPTAGGASTSAQAAGGTATFTGLTITAAGAYSLTVSSGALVPAVAPVTVAAQPATTIVVTGVADQGTTPPLPHPVVGKPFRTSVAFTDAFGNPAALASGVTLTLTKTGGAGTLGGTTTGTAQPGDTTATISGSTYSQLDLGVVLRVSAPGLTAGTFTTDIAGQAATVVGQPFVSLGTIVSKNPTTGATCTLSATQTTCSKFFLPNGADGNVYLYQTACATGCKTAGGTTAQIVYGTADLTDGNGTALYNRNAPAAMVIDCYKALCPHPDYEKPGEVYSLHELQEDVAANPVEMTVFLPGSKTDTFTGIATICAATGVVDAGKLFCIDPKKSTRDSVGYHPYVLFIGDPKSRII